MTLQEKQEGFLLDALEYYCQDPEKRRCTMITGECFYAPISSHTEGCMIGRKLPLGIATTLDSLAGTFSSTGISNSYVFELIPEELKELTVDFLNICQQLHDGGFHWNLEGLTDLGKQMLKLEIINRFNLNESKFEKYL